jgi:hypothetical protein
MNRRANIAGFSLFVLPTYRAVDKRFENVNIHKLGLNYLEWYVPKEKQGYK